MEQNRKQIERNNSTGKLVGGQVVDPDRQLEFMGRALKKNLSRQIQFMLNNCVNCGLCAKACHYYFSDGDIEVKSIVEMTSESLILK